MSWFELDADSTLARIRASGHTPTPPSSGAFALRGVVGFTALSVAGFAPWALGGGRLERQIGEGGMYAVCAFVFIALSGPLLRGLILGPGSLGRFYRLFGIGFAAYSAAWIAGWMGLRRVSGHLGSLAGLFVGTLIMGWVFARAFGERRAALPSGLLLFLLNTIGYYVGGWVEGWVAHLPHLSLAGLVLEKPRPALIAMLLWGVCYGMGLGAGLGLSFYLCQRTLRDRLRG